DRAGQAVRPDLRSQQGRKIAVAKVWGRHGIEGGCRGGFPIAFVAGEEEGLVTLPVEMRDIERPSHRTPELVPSECGSPYSARIVEKCVGVQGAVAQEFPNVTVELAGATFRYHVDHVARAPAELCGERIRLNSHFLGFVDTGNPNGRIPV